MAIDSLGIRQRGLDEVVGGDHAGRMSTWNPDGSRQGGPQGFVGAYLRHDPGGPRDYMSARSDRESKPDDPNAQDDIWARLSRQADITGITRKAPPNPFTELRSGTSPHATFAGASAAAAAGVKHTPTDPKAQAASSAAPVAGRGSQNNLNGMAAQAQNTQGQALGAATEMKRVAAALFNQLEEKKGIPRNSATPSPGGTDPVTVAAGAMIADPAMNVAASMMSMSGGDFNHGQAEDFAAQIAENLRSGSYDAETAPAGLDLNGSGFRALTVFARNGGDLCDLMTADPTRMDEALGTSVAMQAAAQTYATNEYLERQHASAGDVTGGGGEGDASGSAGTELAPVADAQVNLAAMGLASVKIKLDPKRMAVAKAWDHNLADARRIIAETEGREREPEADTDPRFVARELSPEERWAQSYRPHDPLAGLNADGPDAPRPGQDADHAMISGPRGPSFSLMI